jgi:hypothetical protein
MPLHQRWHTRPHSLARRPDALTHPPAAEQIATADGYARFLHEPALMLGLPPHPGLVRCLGIATCPTTGLVAGLLMEPILLPNNHAVTLQQLLRCAPPAKQPLAFPNLRISIWTRAPCDCGQGCSWVACMQHVLAQHMPMDAGTSQIPWKSIRTRKARGMPAYSAAHGMSPPARSIGAPTLHGGLHSPV